MKKTTLLLLILSCYQLAISQSSTPDPGFGTNGAIKTYPSIQGLNATSFAKEGLLQADGKLILGLQFNGKTRLTRRLANGTIDAAYGNNGYSVAASMIITAGAIQADGKIVVAGSSNGQSDFILARYNTDGTLDASFGNSGIIITNFPGFPSFLIDVAIAADGKIIAAGQTTTSGVMVRYNSAGTVDNSFGVNGMVLTNFNNADASTIQSLAFQPDGKIIAAGGAFTTNFGDFAIARYNTDGSPDLSFNGTGQVRTDISFNDVARAVVIDINGKIYVGGSSHDGTGTRRYTVARYHATGTLDTDFNAPAGYVTTAFGSGFENLTNIRLQQDGKIVAAGHLVPGTSGTDVGLVRINTNGTVDNSFGTNGNGQVISDINSADEECTFLEIQPDGKIIAGGGSTSFITGFESRHTAFRYNADGTPDAGFGNGGFFAELLPGPNLQYPAVHQQADGKVLAVSESNDQGTNKAFLHRFLANGTADNSFGQNGSVTLHPGTVISLFQPDGKLLVLGFLESNSGDIVLFRYNTDGTVDAGFGNNGTVITDFGGIESAATAAFQPDGKIVIGGLARDDNGSDFLVVRYNVNGTVDAGFGTNGFARVDVTPEESVMAIAIGPDGKILFGGTGITFPPHNTIFRTFSILARLNANGSIDAGFADQGKKIINASDSEAFGNVAIQGDNKVVFTSFIASNPVPIAFLGRLNTDGSTDNGFGQNGTINCDGYLVAIQADQKILVFGSKKNNRNDTEFVLSRFTTSGNPDPSFGNNGQTVHSFALDNHFFASHFTGLNLYVAGGGVDEFGLNLGLIGKFIIACPPPDITAIGVTPNLLWPPNHTMKDIAVNYAVSAGCALADTQIVVSSNEPIQTGEPGDLAPDWQVINDHLVKLRAERSNAGNGRIYTIKVIVTDVNGNKDSATATVSVPKSQGNPGDENFLVTVYPNPSPAHFNVLILSRSNEQINVRVLNNHGKVIKTIRNLRPQQIFRIGDDLKKGIYFIEATQGAVSKTTKIVKL